MNRTRLVELYTKHSSRSLYRMYVFFITPVLKISFVNYPPEPLHHHSEWKNNKRNPRRVCLGYHVCKKSNVNQPRQRRKQNSLLFLDMRSQSIEIHRSHSLPHVWFFDRDHNIAPYNTETMSASIVDLLAQIACTPGRPQEQFRRATLECKSQLRNRMTYTAVRRAT